MVHQGLGFAWDTTFQKFKATVDATALIEDRYVLKAILHCQLSSNYEEISFEPVRFNLYEVT